MQLPKHLQPWASILSKFPDDVAMVLGHLAQKLNCVIGAYRSLEITGDSVPDGYEGITRRGPYERLLISEWLFADELPDEFNRRVAMQEQLFTQLKLQNKRSTLRTVVLFDSGPFQLGAPRIVQLALLIVLARRAQKANSEFYWGILQELDKGLYESVDHYAVTLFLKSRSSLSVTQQLKHGWSEIMRQYEGAEDVWVIGAEDHSLSYPEMSHVWIEDSWDNPGREVDTCISRRGSIKRLTVELPESDMCARLLRDPYQLRKVPKYLSASSIVGKSDIIFSMNGRRLAYRTESGRIISYAIPNSANAKMGKPKYFRVPDEHHLIGVDIRRKAILAITKKKDVLYFHRFHGSGQAVTETRCFQHIGVDGEQNKINQFYVVKNNLNQACVYLMDNKSQLRHINMDAKSRRVTTMVKSIVGVGRVGNGVYYAVHNKGESELTIFYMENHLDATSIRFALKSSNLSRMSAYACDQWGRNNIGLLVAKVEGQEWLMIYENNAYYLSVDTGLNVIGAAMVFEQDKHVPCLIVIKDKREFAAHTIHNKYFPLLTINSDADVACVNPHRAEIVYSNASKELVVYSIDRSVEVMHALAREAE